MTVEERLSNGIGEPKRLYVVGKWDDCRNALEDAKDTVTIEADGEDKDVSERLTEALDKVERSSVPTVFITDGIELIPILTKIGECVSIIYTDAIDAFGVRGIHKELVDRISGLVSGKSTSTMGGSDSLPYSVFTAWGDKYDPEENYIPI